MQQLAGDAVELVASSGVAKASHVGHLRRLYRVHAWLQQLDGAGLMGLLPEGQLQQGAVEAGAVEAAAWDWRAQGL
jgi:hypothetical protein